MLYFVGAGIGLGLVLSFGLNLPLIPLPGVPSRPGLIPADPAVCPGGPDLRVGVLAIGAIAFFSAMRHHAAWRAPHRRQIRETRRAADRAEPEGTYRPALSTGPCLDACTGD